MEVKLRYKLAQMDQMLYTLEQAITISAHKRKSIHTEEFSEEALTMFRDSIIQRLEYCVDHFWKLLKTYLEEAHGLTITENGPKPIARIAALNGLINEAESSTLIKMIQERNKTSHLYKEEIANEIARFAPQGLLFMQTVLKRLQTKQALLDSNE